MRPDSHPDPAPRRTHFVTVCQQLLALGAVIAVLTPATSIVSLEVVPHGGGVTASTTPDDVSYAQVAAETAEVPTRTVKPRLKEYPLTAPAGARSVPGGLAARVQRTRGGAQKVVSKPQEVRGHGTLGVTWAPGTELDHDAIELEVRTRGGRGTAWSSWDELHYDPDHGPDPDSAEAQGARPGTDPTYVGDVEKVQVRVVARRSAPADMRLAVVDPGEAHSTREEAPQIVTDGDGAPTGERAAAEPEADEGEGDLVLRAGTVTPRPTIFSRKQWGADERIRESGPPDYGKVHAGFVHHTVSANAYSRAEVPGIIRGIYAYHVRGNGWRDVGYNFLVDRFGRIWEGRFGGIDRAVVGAHTYGFNDAAFAMSAIGNFETARPGSALLAAYGALMGWKLSLHGVSAADASQSVNGRTFKAINGHRDADSTACPGRHLYAQLPAIRSLASRAQKGWSGRELETNLVGSRVPDLVVRRASDGAGFVLPVVRRSDGSYGLGRAQAVGVSFAGAQRIMHAGDWDRNGYSDIMYRTRANALYLVRRTSTGTWAPPLLLRSNFAGSRIAAVGDWTGDGWPDLMMQPANRPLLLFPGRGTSGVGVGYSAYPAIDSTAVIPVGRFDADGAPDMLTKKGNALTVRIGNGPGGIVTTRRVRAAVGEYDWMVGVHDTGLTPGHGDLLVRSRADKRVFLVPMTAAGLQPRIPIGSAGAFDMAG